jgi:hypothetical protein
MEDYGHVCKVEASSTVWLQIDFMKKQGLLEKTHNRRRDEQSMYMEESCKFKHLSKTGRLSYGSLLPMLHMLLLASHLSRTTLMVYPRVLRVMFVR